MIRFRPQAALLTALAALLAACTGTGTGTGTNAPAASRWQPHPRTAWQWQLSGKVSLKADVPVYDIDGFDNTAGTVAELHRRGRKAICYISGDFDFAVNEQCAEFDECARLKPFISAGKAVFHVEYNLPPHRFCAQSRRLGLSSMEKRLELGTWRAPC